MIINLKDKFDWCAKLKISTFVCMFEREKKDLLQNYYQTFDIS